YASEILPLGDHSSAKWAAIGVVVFTALNVAGTIETKTVQKLMEIVLVSALVLMALFALFASSEGVKPAAPANPNASFGLAMIFVLLTYGGWNEAAYISGEVRDARRKMTPILIVGIVAVTALYLLVNA